MAKLEDLTPGTVIQGVSSDAPVNVITIKWFGESAVDLTCKILDSGRVYTRLLYRDDEPSLEVFEKSPRWSFSGHGQLFRLASEAWRIKLFADKRTVPWKLATISAG